jgi:adenylate kinase
MLIVTLWLLEQNNNCYFKIIVKRMLNLVLFGPPGAGKGTQSAKLIEKYQLVHISTGDLFRMHISNDTDLGKRVKQILADGMLVPDSITIDMLEEEVKKNPDAKGFIFDGFPRTVAQAEALDAYLDKNGQTINGVVQLEVNEDEIKSRIAERQKVSGRADDDADKLLKRIDEYFSKTVHVLPYYEAQGKVSKVNGIGNIEEIFSNICTAIDAL